MSAEQTAVEVVSTAGGTASPPSQHPAAEYIRELFRPGDHVCVTLINHEDKTEPKQKTFNNIFTAADLSSEETISSLGDWNRKGWSIYACMQPVKAGSSSRKKEDVAEVRRVFLDVDENAAEVYAKVLTCGLVPEPHWVLESSPGKLQLIWNVKPMPPAELESLLGAMIQEFGADPACSDVSRVLRLPGFRNCKYPERPLVELKDSPFLEPVPFPRAAFKVSSNKQAPLATTSLASEDSGFKRLCQTVGFRSLVRRINSLPDARYHIREAEIVPGRNIVCPFHAHKSWDAQFGTIPGNPLVVHCFGNCAKTGDGKTSWDVISAVAKFDNLPSNIDAARRICEEEGLDFNTFFPPPPACILDGQRIDSGAQQAPATVANSKTVNLRRADQVKMKKLSWLWPKRIPLGKVCAFSGNPGGGKSLATVWCASAITTGRDWPDCKNTFSPSEALILSGEDDVEDTLVPRLVAGGADLSKVHILHSALEWSSTGGKLSSTERELQLDTDLRRLEEVMNAHQNIKLIVIDPISDYLGAAKMIDEKQVRQLVLTPLRNFAARFNVAVLMVLHLNKKCDLSAIHRISGAMAFSGVARSAWLFVSDPEDKDVRYMLPIKNNLCKTSGGMRYRIFSQPVEIEGETEYLPVIQWEGVVDKDPDDLLLGITDKKEPGRPSVMQDATEWLKAFLRGGPQPVSDVYDVGDGKEGLSKRTLQRASALLKLEKFKQDNRWWWRLPAEFADAEFDRFGSSDLQPSLPLEGTT